MSIIKINYCIKGELYMKELNRTIGAFGEDLAINFLIRKNHTLIERNFRKRNGEIDIITKFKDIIVFTEVKTRYTLRYGLPCEAVDYKKQNKIKSIASYFIHINKLYNINIRFDVIQIFLNTYDDNYKIIYIEDAFR